MRHPIAFIILSAMLSVNISCGSDTSTDNNRQDATSDMTDTTQDTGTTPDTGITPDAGTTPDVSTEPCDENQSVQNNECVACPVGTSNLAGDDPSGANTMCVATLCAENEKVQDNACVVCELGATNDAGDDASVDNSLCDAILCEENTRVQENKCVSCDGVGTNMAGDDASGENTSCDDACSKVLGVSCADFEQAYVKASTPDAFDFFGGSVSIDENTMVIGAVDERSNATGVNGDETNDTIGSAGAAYVFVRTGATWTQQAYLKASNTDFNDKFGTSVAIDGDTIVVGAQDESSDAKDVDGAQDNNNAQKSGAAYVFVRIGTNWTQQAYLKASNTGAFDSFGRAVAVDGDTIAVGAYREDSSLVGINNPGIDNQFAGSSGAVYVFTRNGTTWSNQAYIKASNAGTTDEFGFALSLEGETLAVGAPKESSSSKGIDMDQTNDSAFNAGAVYVFSRAGIVWSQQAYIKASNTEGDDTFGWSLDMDGDTIIVGAPGESGDAVTINGDETNNNATSSGAAYVFFRQGNSWSQQAYLKASNTRMNTSFGYSVAISDQIAAVGSPLESSDATGVNGDQTNTNTEQSGAVYLFTRQAANWSQQAYLKSSNPDAFDFFGNALTLDGNTLLVGAPKESSRAVGIDGDQTNNLDADAGAIYVRQIAP